MTRRRPSWVRGAPEARDGSSAEVRASPAPFPPLLAEHPGGDDDALDLRRTFVDAQRADLAVETLDGEAAQHAGAAVDLHRAIDDPLRRLGGEHLGHRGLGGDRLDAVVPEA